MSFSAFDNRELDWDLTLITSQVDLKDFMMQKCGIKGTLPDLTQATKLACLMLHENKMSGTLHESGLPLTSLETLSISKNKCVECDGI